eukprot:3904053-Prymnesium_polylepis.1
MEARYGQKRVPTMDSVLALCEAPPARLTFQGNRRLPQALKSSVGALRACTPQKGHMLRVS